MLELLLKPDGLIRVGCRGCNIRFGRTRQNDTRSYKADDKEFRR